ncbi:hypothetical protein F511_43293 [Dorcoceras hygrometricum]|uniref:Dystroglycan-like n=1 Tax=Dorcoceras hygrometricum TaxID=472368 RepID=A0A2Z7DFC8_9LAMI|nr:hypothetical protein F511_43293 [Dorcoceras hygrometricum]
MAASFYSNSIHVDFDSVLAMDEPGMVSMFHALVASGLQGFLGCSAVVYEEALVEFFANGRVRDGLVVSSVDGVSVEISEELFAETFELPVDGLGDLSEMPKDVVFDARSIVSLSGEPISLSGRKNQMKFEFRLLCDIMAKAISVKAGSFNAITVEKFSLMTVVVCRIRMNWAKFLFSILKKMVTPGSKQAKGFAIQISLLLATIPTLELGESSEFPASKILTKKTVHRFVSINDRDGAEEVTGLVISTEVPHQRQYDDTLPTMSVFFKLMTKRWADVCLEIVWFCASQRLLPVGSIQFCRSLQLAEPVSRIAPSRSPVFALRVYQFCSIFVDLSLFNWFPSAEITEFLSAIALDRTVLRSVQSFQNSFVPSVQLSLEQQQSSSSSTSSSSSLHSDKTDVDATASSVPPVSQDISAAFADLQANLSEKIFEYQSVLSSKLHKIEQSVCDSLRDQADIFRNLSQGARKEARTLDDVQSIRFNEFHKNILAQNASIFQGLADVRQEVQAVNAKVDIMASRLNAIQKDAEATKEALSHQLLEFQSSAQENHSVLHAQLSELVDYIHRGGANKKGESGSRGLQQPASTQIEGSAERPTFAQRVEMAQRRIVHTVLDADRALLARQDAAERDRERRRREARSLKRRRKD